MGYDASAYAIIGLCVTRDQLYRAVRARVCKHPETNAKFCPECGEPMFRKAEEPIPGYDENNEKLLDFEVLTPNHDRDDRYIVAFRLGGRNTPAFCQCRDIPDIGRLAGEMVAELAKLEPPDLWNYGQFGLWAILEESY